MSKELACAALGGLGGALLLHLYSVYHERCEVGYTSTAVSTTGYAHGEYYIGVDIGGTTIQISIVSNGGEIIGKIFASELSQATEDRSEQKIIALVVSNIHKCLRESDKHLLDIKAVGVGSPGVNDLERGIILRASNFPNWDHFNIANTLSKALGGIPVVLENDAKAALLAEAWVGAGQGCQDIAMMTLGTGIGGAVLSGGRVLRGATGMAGEIGHAIFIPNGRSNHGTGVKGIFEEYTSAKSLGALAMETIVNNDVINDSSLKAYAQTLSIDVSCKDVFEHAEHGDQHARKLLSQTIEYLGIGCINLCRYYDPSVILLSGGMTLAGQKFVDRIQECFLKHHWSIFKPNCEIKLATTGNAAGVIGAAYAAKLHVEMCKKE